MQKISQRPRPWLALLPLLFFFAVLALIALHPAWQGTRPLPRLILALPLIVTLIISLFIAQFFSGLAQEVWDGGDHLRIVFSRGVMHLPLRDISNISYNGTSNPPRVTLRLRQDSSSGREISFLVKRPFSLHPLRSHPLIDELIDRVDQQRSTGVHR